MKSYQKVEDLIEFLINSIGKNIRLASPLAMGKSNIILNEIYKRAKNDPSISLEIYTAITLDPPAGKTFFEKAFLSQVVKRLYGKYPILDYQHDRKNNKLPDNVKIYEFYLFTGKELGNEHSQRNYISSNYTHVVRDLIDRDINCYVQMVSPGADSKTISLSCNPDVCMDILDFFKYKSKHATVSLAHVNPELPFMYGDAMITRDKFDACLENDKYNYPLFPIPRLAIKDSEFLIGLYVSTLIKDGGELQIGIGSLGNALAYSLLLRHKNNDLYKKILNEFNIIERYGDLIKQIGGIEPFKTGLFAATEMLVDAFMPLLEAGIIKKKVYNSIILQKLINKGLIGDKITINTIKVLAEEHVITKEINKKDFEFLQFWGIFNTDVQYKKTGLLFINGSDEEIDLLNDDTLNLIEKYCLGDYLKNGAMVQAGFFLGAKDFYQYLHALPEHKKEQIHMNSISKINQLFGHEEIDRLHRKDARFVNTGMIVSINGAVASDGLENNRVVSGVGGQYNFASMAQELPDGHSIIQIRSVRNLKGQDKSNIVWNYGYNTIPRHLRDIIVTEYGIAFIRGKSDEEVAIELLKITDSRYQRALMEKAKRNQKLCKNFKIDNCHRTNFPQNIEHKLEKLRTEYKAYQLFDSFPFGSDFTNEEIVIGKALKFLKSMSYNRIRMIIFVTKSLITFARYDDLTIYLNRMGLIKVGTIRKFLYKRLFISALRATIDSSY